MMMEKSSVCAVVKPKLAADQTQQEQLPCPRCHSTNTKFCYYNNYNFSQPRHFCKSCRRYWTHGGTLRDIPIGGGSRKSAKRCRTSASYNSASSSGVVTPSSSSSSHEFLNSTPVFLPSAAGYGAVGGGGFTSLLTGNHGPGVWALGGGFGLGLGSGLVEDTSFGLGKGGWAFGDVGYGGSHSSAAVVEGGGSVGGATWQLEGGENGGFVAGSDCFGWPELAISTPGNRLK
ncbi:hypothetical protein QQ045_025144 [Rhodiola kirilowii]